MKRYRLFSAVENPSELVKEFEGPRPGQPMSEFIAAMKDYAIGRLDYLSQAIPEVKDKITLIYQDLGILEANDDLTFGQDNTVVED